MCTKLAVRLMAVGMSAVLFSSTVAHANPATPMSAIEATAVQLCRAIAHDPSAHGVVEAMKHAAAPGFDEMDYSMTIMAAMHHTCPQYGDLFTSIAAEAASDELCGRPV
jgi:hypothetical protein